MPVHVRHHIAETGQIDLVRVHGLEHAQFAQTNGFSYHCGFFRSQIHHFGGMALDDHAHKSGQVIVGRVNDSNEFSAPNHAFVNRITKRTVVYHSVESGSARSPQR